MRLTGGYAGLSGVAKTYKVFAHPRTPPAYDVPISFDMLQAPSGRYVRSGNNPIFF